VEIQKVEIISYKEFIQEYYLPGIPLIFKNASKVWKARGLFNPDWFRKSYGDRLTEIEGKSYSMNTILDLVESSSLENPAPYPCIFNIPKVLPEILEFVQPLDLNYSKPNWLNNRFFTKGKWGGVTELFIGGPGGKFPYLHLDIYHLNAWITQLHGEKQFTIFPKGQEHLLYPLPDDPWRSEIDIYNPDLQKYPKYKDATPINVIVGPGETLFIPAGIWHTAYSLTPTISIANDQLNDRNYKEFLKDVWSFSKRDNLAKAIIKTGYAIIAGLVCRLENRLLPRK
jgi:histone arginine demethylase JMJD6